MIFMASFVIYAMELNVPLRSLTGVAAFACMIVCVFLAIKSYVNSRAD